MFRVKKLHSGLETSLEYRLGFVERGETLHTAGPHCYHISWIHNKQRPIMAVVLVYFILDILLSILDQNSVAFL